LSQKPISRQKNAEKSTESNGGIFLSTDSQEIQNRISRPLSARQPVGYQKKFIDKIFDKYWILRLPYPIHSNRHFLS